ncbi:NRDE family protein [Paenalkalicoccus suaedae]|uniref:NRDE family protein n=1 Tax=Paenalkalicoccus suaedae TaxID=2592382 RepID=A0A859FEM3_9BACI|nr:NRDE family protein [Paenalkalicoccus suaedae]QKS71152.1 NRDE family protein [Paenalkalicoccus suaedae]
MCIVGVALNHHPEYPFILASNRDEFLHRPTKNAYWWDDGILAGQDLDMLGTWLGMTKSGKLATLTNVRREEAQSSFPHSRGELVTSYLRDERAFYARLNEKEHFAGFNLLYGDITSLQYVSNHNELDSILTSGVHAMSNGNLDDKWPKMRALESKITDSKSLKGDDLTGYLFHSLANAEPYEASSLPKTGVSDELERSLSSIYIDIEGYGTRTSTVILVDRNNKCTFIERDHAAKNSVSHSFTLNRKTR